MKARTAVACATVVLMTLACLGGPSLSPPKESSGKDIPVYRQGAQIQVADSDKAALVGDILGSASELYFSSTDIRVTANAAATVEEALDQVLPDSGWRLEADWASIRQSLRTSTWRNGDLRATVILVDNLDSAQISDYRKRYGLSGLEPGSTLVITHLWDMLRPFPTTTPTRTLVPTLTPVPTSTSTPIPSPTPAPSPIVLVNDRTSGYYSEALETLLDGTQLQFPPADQSGGDPFIDTGPGPSLSVAATVLGDWLAANPLPLNENWSSLRAIPQSTLANIETVVIYPIDAGTSGITGLTGNFGADNGIFVWVNGVYKFGAHGPGAVSGFEYRDIDLGDLPPGLNFVQVLREDHGDFGGYTIEIEGWVARP